MNLSFALSSIATFVLSSSTCEAFGVLPSSRTHQRSALAESPNGGGGELWKVERVDHISDWAETKVYPNPLSLKENVPSSWFVGLNDAVAAKVQIDAQERYDETCELPDDYDDVNGSDVDCDRGLNAEAFICRGLKHRGL